MRLLKLYKIEKKIDFGVIYSLNLVLNNRTIVLLMTALWIQVRIWVGFRPVIQAGAVNYGRCRYSLKKLQLLIYITINPCVHFYMHLKFKLLYNFTVFIPRLIWDWVLGVWSYCLTSQVFQWPLIAFCVIRQGILGHHCLAWFYDFIVYSLIMMITIESFK